MPSDQEALIEAGARLQQAVRDYLAAKFPQNYQEYSALRAAAETAEAETRALLGAADPTTQKTKLDRVHAMLDRLRPHLPADLFGELAAIVYISDRPMTADDIRRGQEVAQLLDNPDAARNPTDPTLDVSLSPNIKEALRRNALNGNPIVLFGVEYIPAKPTLMERLVDATVPPLAAFESGTHCSCGRALPCRHCTQEENP